MEKLTQEQRRIILEFDGDRNSFARGFLGYERYKELGLAKINLNEL